MKSRLRMNWEWRARTREVKRIREAAPRFSWTMAGSLRHNAFPVPPSHSIGENKDLGKSSTEQTLNDIVVELLDSKQGTWETSATQPREQSSQQPQNQDSQQAQSQPKDAPRFHFKLPKPGLPSTPTSIPASSRSFTSPAFSTSPCA
jgi:hypothetical protein